jgi:hypothetical protein
MNGFTYRTTLMSTEEIVNTPAGQFDSCYNFIYLIEELYTDFSYYYAPNIGLVRRLTEGLEIELKGAVINNVLYGDTTYTYVEKHNQTANFNTCTLYQNHPNPFNSSTIIKYDLPEADQVSLKIFNIEGQLVTELVNKTQPAGTWQVIWDGKNSQQEAVTSGIYFCQFKTRQYWQTVRVILLR